MEFGEGKVARDTFTHWAMLRVMWLHLSRVGDRAKGREAAVSAIFEGMCATQKNYFHQTFAYFWLQLVDLAIHLPGGVGEHAAAAKFSPRVQGFVNFLLTHSWLADDALVTEFYSKKRMCQTPEAVYEFVLPDLRPLPSILSLGPLAVS